MTLATITTRGIVTEYSLNMTHRIFGIIGRGLERTLKFVGEDKRVIDGVEHIHYVLRDATPGASVVPGRMARGWQCASSVCLSSVLEYRCGWLSSGRRGVDAIPP